MPSRFLWIHIGTGEINMAYQCKKCMVTYEDGKPHVNRKVFRCEVPGCEVRYMEVQTADYRVKMFLVEADE